MPDESSSSTQSNVDTVVLCKTTGWHNNCGLNCLTHFLAAKLKSGELQQSFAANPAYQSLLVSFQQYYALAAIPSWDEINTLLNTHDVPTDKEAILAPVLRLHLGKLLQREPEDLWNRFASDGFCEYLKTGQADDSAQTLFDANQVWFKQHRILYLAKHADDQARMITDDELTMVRVHFENCVPPKDTAVENLCAQVLFNREQNLLTQFQEEGRLMWLDSGGMNYANYMGNLAHDALVTADQLQLLANELSIGIEITSSAGAFMLPEEGFHWTLKINNSGLHWEFYPFEQDETTMEDSVKKHNACYPSSFYEEEFLNDGSLSGQFKIFIPEVSYQAGVIDSIKQSVKAHLAAAALLTLSSNNQTEDDTATSSEAAPILALVPAADSKRAATQDVRQLDKVTRRQTTRKRRFS